MTWWVEKEYFIFYFLSSECETNSLITGGRRQAQLPDSLHPIWEGYTYFLRVIKLWNQNKDAIMHQETQNWLRGYILKEKKCNINYWLKNLQFGLYAHI